MQSLNLPEYTFKIKSEEDKRLIFDEVRKKFVVLTPEEWVRQNFIQYLVNEKGYSKALMAVEKQLFVNGRQQRFDLVIFNRKALPEVIAEFKAPGVKLTQDAFDQVVRYNMALKVKYVIVSNGLQHFACEVDYVKRSYSFLKEIPVL